MTMTTLPLSINLVMVSESKPIPQEEEPPNGVLIVKGHVVYTTTPEDFTVHPSSYLVVRDGRVDGVFQTLPEEYSSYQLMDFGDRLIIPGFVDLHLHGAQFLQCGIGMTKTLLDWLNDYTFELERRFNDPEFARQAYTIFAKQLVACGTLRASIYASSSTNGTEQLFEALKQAGIGAYVGLVAMDRNCPDYLLKSTAQVMEGVENLFEKYGDEPLVRPIITPRFAPTCSPELLEKLGDFACKNRIPAQSHLNECHREIAWVKELFPDAASYSEVYDRYDLFGSVPTLMAHCIHMSTEELQLVKQRGVFMVHCPDSNINVRSGIMEVKKYLKQGFSLGLGSDIAGGHKLAMNEAIVKAIQLSKLHSLTSEEEPLSVSETFYLSTKAGGSFFGKTGSLEQGFFFDALVLEDDPLISENYSITDRLEKFLYTGDDRNICARFVEGRLLEASNIPAESKKTV